MRLNDYIKNLRSQIESDNIDSANDVHEQSVGRWLRRKDRLEKILDLEKLGCNVQDCPSGLLVNNKFIIQMKRQKWRVVGSGKWYWYKSIPDFFLKYVSKMR